MTEPLNDQEWEALAHPLRFRLLDALINHGPSTATKLGEQLGESSGATSYHLRQLARYGLVEENPEKRSIRERWWRAASLDRTLEAFALGKDTEAPQEARLLVHELLRGRTERLQSWFGGLAARAANGTRQASG